MRSRLGLLFVSTLVACSGRIGETPRDDVREDPRKALPRGGAGGPASPPGAVEACHGLPDPGLTPLQRLTDVEYNNSVRDLLGAAAGAPVEFPAAVSQPLAERQLQAAEEIAARTVERLESILPCARVADDACARTFVGEFGKKIFRRPLETAEVARYFGLYTKLKPSGFRSAIAGVLAAMLQSPKFLYRPEIGLPPRAGDPLVRLTPWEVATRLSYLVVQSTPDAELMKAAETGGLDEPAQIEAHVRRLLATPAARPAMNEFLHRWLEPDLVEQATKDAKAFPRFTPAIARLLRAETERFWNDLVFDSGGDVTALLLAGHSFMNQQLASYYGAAGPTGTAFERVSLDPSQRIGVLTHASLLAAQAKSNQTSPIHRGKLVRTQILCEFLPEPPPGLEVTLPEPSTTTSTRERFEEHRSDVSCAGCHRMIDPIGFAFEHYDAIGLWRATENRKPIDPSGEIFGSDVPGAFHGAIELARKLAGSRQARECVAVQYLRFKLNRVEGDEDACLWQSTIRSFAQGGYRLVDLPVALARNPAFLHRRRVDL